MRHTAHRHLESTITPGRLALASARESLGKLRAAGGDLGVVRMGNRYDGKVVDPREVGGVARVDRKAVGHGGCRDHRVVRAG